MRRRALRAWAPPAELTSRPSRRLVSGQRCTAYSSWTSRVYSASRQIHALAWSRLPIRRSTSARSMIFVASLRSSRGQPPMMSIAVSKASGSRQRGDVRERPQAQLRVLVALHGGDQEAPLAARRRGRSGASRARGASRWAAPARRPARPRRAARRSRGAPRRSATAHAQRPRRGARLPAHTGSTRRSTRMLRPRPRRTGPTTIAPPR